MQNRNKQIVINEIIKKIYYIEDYDEMRQTFVNMIGSVIRCKVADYFVADSDRFHNPPVSNMFTKEVLYDYLENYESDDPTTWFYMSGKSMVYREKDMFDMNVVEKSDFYLNCCVPYNIHDALMAALATNGEYIGLVTLYREMGDEEFSDDDIFVMELFKEHLECRHIIEVKKDSAKKASSMSEPSMKFIREYNLTLREVEILELLLDGKSNDYISGKLTISPNTVKKHLINIYRKLNISRRSELIKFK